MNDHAELIKRLRDAAFQAEDDKTGKDTPESKLLRDAIAALEAGRSGEAEALEAARADLRAAAATLRETLDRLWPLETAPQQPPPVGDVTLPFESALAELIDLLCPGLDSGDILADAKTASATINRRDGLLDRMEELADEWEDNGWPDPAKALRSALSHQQPAPSVSPPGMSNRDLGPPIPQHEVDALRAVGAPGFDYDDEPAPVSEPAASGEGLRQLNALAVEFFRLWFFRDIVDEQRQKLLVGAGVMPDPAEPTTHGHQRLALDELIRRLTTTGQADVERLVEAARGALRLEPDWFDPLTVALAPFGQQQEVK